MNRVKAVTNKTIKGISMFEVILTIFITLLAIHSFFNISISGLSSIYSNKNNLQAMILSQDIANRIEANANIAKTTDSYVVNEFIVDNNDCKNHDAINYCSKQPCSSIEIANYDIDFWKNSIACRLKQAIVTIKYSTKKTTREYEIIFEFQYDKNTNKIRKISTYKSV